MAILVCPSCGTRYRVAESTLAHASSVRCKTCRTVFPWQDQILVASGSESPSRLLQTEHAEQPAAERLLAPELRLPTGSVLKTRYRLEEVLGQGGMGVTYKATDLTTQNIVAVKVLHFSHLHDWKTLEMFEREAAILKQLDHPQIPDYLDYAAVETQTDIQFMLVQEYIEGNTLEQLVEKGWRWSEKDAINILMQLLDILEYLHTLTPPVIHRDINPKNIIMTSEKRIYLVDFGAVQERIRTTVLGGSTIVGTYGYVPFEQFSDQTVPASDYYALGATLLFLLTHQHPADFPVENMKPKFDETVAASAIFLRLLDGLLEPSVEKRLASPEAIRKLLLSPADDPVASHPIQRPYGTKIQKHRIEHDHIQFMIPGTFNAGSLSMLGFAIFWLTFVAFWTAGAAMGSVFFALFSIPFWIVGIGMLSAAVHNLFGRTTLNLTPSWIELRYKFCGLGYSKRIPTASVGHVRSEIAYTKNSQSVEKLCITAGAKNLRFGSALSSAEKEWLAREIQEYVALYARPLLRSE